jgi:hypothetical protein
MRIAATTEKQRPNSPEGGRYKFKNASRRSAFVVAVVFSFVAATFGRAN